MNKQYLWTAAALTAGMLATTQTFAQVTLNVATIPWWPLLMVKRSQKRLAFKAAKNLQT